MDTPRFSQIPHNLLLSMAVDTRPKSEDRRVWCALLRFYSSERGDAFPTRATIARLTNMAQPNVSRAVRRLENFGYLKIAPMGTRGRNLYKLLSPPLASIAMGINTDTVSMSIPEPVSGSIPENVSPLIPKHTKQQTKPNETSSRAAGSATSLHRVVELAKDGASCWHEIERQGLIVTPDDALEAAQLLSESLFGQRLLLNNKDRLEFSDKWSRWRTVLTPSEILGGLYMSLRRRHGNHGTAPRSLRFAFGGVDDYARLSSPLAAAQ